MVNHNAQWHVDPITKAKRWAVIYSSHIQSANKIMLARRYAYMKADKLARMRMHACRLAFFSTVTATVTVGVTVAVKVISAAFFMTQTSVVI